MKKVIIASLVGLSGCVLLISGYINETGKQDVVVIDKISTNQIEGQNGNNTTTTNTIATTKTKTTKKVVKTTKKATTKKVQKFNIKYNKQEIIDYVHQEVVRRWGEDNWNATYQIIMHESGFNPNSVNKSSGACGLFEALPCNKTIKNGYKDYYTNWKTQVNWGLDYIKYRYKTPLKAWNFWQKHHWY